MARILDLERIPYVALDLDATNVARAHRSGEPVFFGDASRREILDRIGAGRARAFVITTDEPMVAERMTRTIVSSWPNVPVHVRARDRTHAQRLVEIGARGVVPETLESSLQLAGRVLSDIGLPDETIELRLAVLREEERLSKAGGSA